MRKALLWIESVIPKKPIIPIYNHLSIKDYRVTCADGNIIASHPVADTLAATPHARMLVDAFKLGGENDHIALSQLDNGSLVVKRKNTKITIPCTTELYPTFPTGGGVVQVPYAIRTALSAIRKFVIEDHARPMFRSVLFRGASVMASNNVTIAEYWGGVHTPFNFALPVESVDAILAIPEEPLYMELSQTWVRFHYANGAWLQTNFQNEPWPDLSQFLLGDWQNFPVIPDGLWDAVATVKPFLGEQINVTVTGGSLVTPAAQVEVAGLTGEVVTTHKHLAQLKGTALALKFGTPIRWIGNSIRGVTFGRAL